jgi:hypothetical protein
MDRLQTKTAWTDVLVAEKVLQRFSIAGPHVIYDGGELHSNVALNINRLLTKPARLESLCQDILDSLPEGLARSVDVVSTHCPYGGPVATVVAKLLGVCAHLFDPATGDWTPSPPPTGRRSLVVSEEILTASRMKRLLQELDRLSVPVMPVLGVLADFASPDLVLEQSVIACVREPIQLWSRSGCPLCAAGSPPRRRLDLY